MLLLFMPVPCNKLYLWTVEWNETITLREILATSDDSVVGFFVEVDIAYPSSLHDSHNDLPLAPEKIDSKVMVISLRTIFQCQFTE